MQTLAVPSRMAVHIWRVRMALPWHQQDNKCGPCMLVVCICKNIRFDILISLPLVFRGLPYFQAHALTWYYYQQEECVLHIWAVFLLDAVCRRVVHHNAHMLLECILRNIGQNVCTYMCIPLDTCAFHSIGAPSDAWWRWYTWTLQYVWLKHHPTSNIEVYTLSQCSRNSHSICRHPCTQLTCAYLGPTRITLWWTAFEQQRQKLCKRTAPPSDW